MEFHHQLSTDSFSFHEDESCEESEPYVTISHSTQQKNCQMGIKSDEAPADRRMYSTRSASCRVKNMNMLKLLLSKSDRNEGPCALFTQTEET